jgi:SpoIIAA-like
MLTHELLAKDEILILRPQGPLKARDFTSLATIVDSWLAGGGKLRGVLISAKSFPGWEDLDGLIEHLRFVRNHHDRVERIAIVADGFVAKLLPNVGRHFVHAKLRHFADDAAALAWLKPPPCLEGPEGAVLADAPAADR